MREDGGDVVDVVVGDCAGAVVVVVEIEGAGDDDGVVGASDFDGVVVVVGDGQSEKCSLFRRLLRWRGWRVRQLFAWQKRRTTRDRG